MARAASRSQLSGAAHHDHGRVQLREGRMIRSRCQNTDADGESPRPSTVGTWPWLDTIADAVSLAAGDFYRSVGHAGAVAAELWQAGQASSRRRRRVQPTKACVVDGVGATVTYKATSKTGFGGVDFGSMIVVAAPIEIGRAHV